MGYFHLFSLVDTLVYSSIALAHLITEASSKFSILLTLSLHWLFSLEVEALGLAWGGSLNLVYINP